MSIQRKILIILKKLNSNNSSISISHLKGDLGEDNWDVLIQWCKKNNYHDEDFEINDFVVLAMLMATKTSGESLLDRALDLLETIGDLSIPKSAVDTSKMGNPKFGTDAEKMKPNESKFRKLVQSEIKRQLKHKNKYIIESEYTVSNRETQWYINKNFIDETQDEIDSYIETLKDIGVTDIKFKYKDGDIRKGFKVLTFTATPQDKMKLPKWIKAVEVTWE